jgi:predicted alternative tryptophan synthase beta-subunit
MARRETRAFKFRNPKYALGSARNHVWLHQTATGQETIRQTELASEEPDSIIACACVGSNFAGFRKRGYLLPATQGWTR